MGCNNFSVFNQKTRTTSAVEAYNGVLGRYAEKHCHFFKFVGLIRNEEFYKSRHFAILCESGGSLSKKRRRLNKDQKIQEASLLLEKGSITVNVFLSRMVYERNEICVNMVPKLDIFDEENLEDELADEDLQLPISSNENECVVCKDKAPNVALLPCKHLKICDECHVKLLAEAVANNTQNYNCTVEDSIQVYI